MGPGRLLIGEGKGGGGGSVREKSIFAYTIHWVWMEGWGV